jgi:hypothetical protein
MDNGLIFPYHHVRAKTDPNLLRKALRGLPTQLALGQRWGDTEG